VLVTDKYQTFDASKYKVLPMTLEKRYSMSKKYTNISTTCGTCHVQLSAMRSRMRRLQLVNITCVSYQELSLFAMKTELSFAAHMLLHSGL